MVVLGHLTQGAELAAVDAAAERLLAGAGEDGDPDVVVQAHVQPRLPQLQLHGEVEGVHDLGPVQGDPGDVVVDLEGDRLELAVSHGAF